MFQKSLKNIQEDTEHEYKNKTNMRNILNHIHNIISLPSD
jgi:hypothetical protein